MHEEVTERGLYITKLKDLEHYDSKFSRLYFGNEFCQRLIPSPQELEKAIEFTIKENLGFTFVTPFVTNEGLEILDPLFRKISQEKPDSEVVFNDWGVLLILNQRYSDLEPVMGRLLNKMKRGPRLWNLISILPESTVHYFRSCSLNTPILRRFLIENRVRRVELDNLLQGIDLDLAGSGISASLYIPYAYVTVTRLCLAISCEEHGKEDEIGIFPCKRECQRYSFLLTHPVMPVPLIRKGNTVFFKNEEISEEMIKRNNIDRIVIEPEVPL